MARMSLGEPGYDGEGDVDMSDAVEVRSQTDLIPRREESRADTCVARQK